MPIQGERSSRRAVVPSPPARVLALVFSRDRALQLEATLSSLFRHCRDPRALCGIHVLYRGSTPRYAGQYRFLAAEPLWPVPVVFHEEASFRRDLLEILSLADRDRPQLMAVLGILARRTMTPRSIDNSGRLPWEHLLFVVDDAIFVRPFALGAVVHALRARPRAIGFSLRLGRNTTYCYPRDATQSLPAWETVSPGILAFDWRSAEHDFGYPLEVSSSIYAADVIAGLLSSTVFTTPNTLERSLSALAHKSRVVRRRAELLCFDESVAFCNAIN